MSICKFSNCYNSTNYSWENYCCYHSEQERLKCLVRERAPATAGKICEVTRFSTWWNKNLATFINELNELSDYEVFLLVYEPGNYKVELFPINFDSRKWGEYTRNRHSNLTDAQGEAQWLRGMLTSSSNPILLVHPSCDSYTSFNNLVNDSYFKIDYSASTSEFKPLDIAWVQKRMMGKNYYHVGVYLGNGELIEFTNDYKSGLIPSDEDIIKSLPNFMRGGITRKASWSKFLEGQKGSIRRYHPIIPFKDYKDIIANLVWAKDNGFWRENYNLANRNCEHFSKNVC